MAREEAVERMRTRRARAALVAGVGLLAVVVAGIGLLAYSVFPGGSPAAVASPPKKEESALVERVEEAVRPAPDAPEDTSLTLTVPQMDRVEDVPVYTAPASDDETLDRGALHVEGTGYPWQEEANVYIAGHRLGYRGTGSYLLFYDLDELESGDEVILTDAEGTRYTYEVFREFRVDPDAREVMRPIEGRNVVSLQTCTLPGYKERLIVQAELRSAGR